MHKLYAEFQSLTSELQVITDKKNTLTDELTARIKILNQAAKNIIGENQKLEKLGLKVSSRKTKKEEEPDSDAPNGNGDVGVNSE